MRLGCGLMLALAATFMSHCRSRPEASRTDTAATKAPPINGRIAVFNIFDTATQLTRQAPGTMVSSRGALIPGLKSTETVSLTDDKRTGEKYIPLNTADGSVVFVGLEPRLAAADTDSDAEKTDFNLLPAKRKTLPPLSAQTLAPLDVGSRIVERTRVVLYNDIGYVQALAEPTEDGLLQIAGFATPSYYNEGEDILKTLYNIFFESKPTKAPLMPRQVQEKMLRKGGAVIAGYSKWKDFHHRGNFWELMQKDSGKTGTLDILAYVGEDPLLDLRPYKSSIYISAIKRKDLLPEAIGAAINAVSAKMKVPRALELEILQYLDCDIK